MTKKIKVLRYRVRVPIELRGTLSSNYHGLSDDQKRVFLALAVLDNIEKNGIFETEEKEYTERQVYDDPYR